MYEVICEREWCALMKTMQGVLASWSMADDTSTGCTANRLHVQSSADHWRHSTSWPVRCIVTPPTAVIKQIGISDEITRKMAAALHATHLPARAAWGKNQRDNAISLRLLLFPILHTFLSVFFSPRPICSHCRFFFASLDYRLFHCPLFYFIQSYFLSNFSFLCLSWRHNYRT